MAVNSLFSDYLGQTEPDLFISPVSFPSVNQTPATVTRTTSSDYKPANLMEAAETGSTITADPVDTVYEGDNRPTYIKERTNITAEQYNQFLAEFDDAVAQSNLDYRQAILNQRMMQEATGTTYSPDSQVLQNQQLQDQLFQSAISSVAAKYGVPLTYTTKGGDVWRINPNGKYTKTFDAGEFGIGDFVKLGVSIAIGNALGPLIAGGLAPTVGTATANILGSSLASGFATGLTTGFDKDTMLKAMLSAGLTQGTIELLKTDAVRQALNSVGESIGLPTEFTDTEILDIDGNVINQGTTTSEVLGLGDTLATLVGDGGEWSFDTFGTRKPFFFDKTITSLLDLVPDSVLEALDPYITGRGEQLGYIADFLTGQMGQSGGASGSGTGGGESGASTVLAVEEAEDEINQAKQEEQEEEETAEEETAEEEQDKKPEGAIQTRPPAKALETPDLEQPTEVDSDGDGIVDSLDPDRDGDGVANEDDFDPDDPSIFEDTTKSTLDSDGDGILDSDDDDLDNDGVLNEDDEFPFDPNRTGLETAFESPDQTATVIDRKPPVEPPKGITQIDTIPDKPDQTATVIEKKPPVEPPKGIVQIDTVLDKPEPTKTVVEKKPPIEPPKGLEDDEEDTVVDILNNEEDDTTITTTLPSLETGFEAPEPTKTVIDRKPPVEPPKGLGDDEEDTTVVTSTNRDDEVNTTLIPLETAFEAPEPTKTVIDRTPPVEPPKGLGDDDGDTTVVVGPATGDDEEETITTVLPPTTGGGGSGGMFSLGGTGQSTSPSPFMASISFAPQLLTPLMPKQSKDYLAELLARLQK